MKGSIAVPPAIGCRDQSSFGYFTITRRFPKILTDVRAHAGPACAADPRWDLLLSDVIDGGPIRSQWLWSGTDYWQTQIDLISDCRWLDLSFLYTEFLFYHAVNSVAGFFENGLDVFSHTKTQALREAIPALAHALEDSTAFFAKPRLDYFVAQAIGGNVADLSQLRAESRPGGQNQSLLVDDRRQLLSTLSTSDCEAHIVLDNAGTELCWDLCLTHALLRAGIPKIVLHAKPWPMFVSDAIVPDVHDTVAAFHSQTISRAVRALGKELETQLASGAVCIEADASWGEPRHFGELPSALAARLNAAEVVIAKGDLNYRRFFEDRAWPADTFADAATSSSFAAYTLRVLKSEVVVGMATERAQALDTADPEWRTSGRHAMVQYVPAAHSGMTAR